MEEDILAFMETLTIQENDTDPDPVIEASEGVEPPIQTPPLEGALPTACHRVNHQKKTEETREIFSFSPCLSAAVRGQCTDVVPEVSSDTNGGDNRGKKSSRKRRNRKKSKKVYLSWPVTMETSSIKDNRTSSTNLFPCLASAMGASCSKEQRRKREKAQFRQEPASALLLGASPVQPPLEGISVVARKERKAQKRHQCKKRAKKNQKIESSPWPMTVQAWASFVSPELVQTGFTESLPAANGRIKDGVFALPLSKGTHADILGLHAPLGQASWEEVVPHVNAKRKMKKKIQKRWQGKKENALVHTWPPDIQAWEPFPAATATAAEPVQTLSETMSLQWEFWPPPLENEKETKCFIPWSEGTGEGSFSLIAPLPISLEAPAMKIGQFNPDKAKRSSNSRAEQLQDSEKLALESYQSWGNVKKWPGDQDGDNWECSILHLPTQADCYCWDPVSKGGKAPTLIGNDVYTSISEAETGRQEAVEDKATFQTLWMGKWGGF